MSKETADLISRLNASRDMLKKLNIADYGLIADARDVMADASNGLDAYAKTSLLIEEADRRVVAVLMWLDERGRNSRSYGSHADAYEIAARKLREALGTNAASSEAHAAQVVQPFREPPIPSPSTPTNGPD